MLHKMSQIGEYSIYVLSKDVAETYKEKITSIWNLIPLSHHVVDDILQESNGTSVYLGKWEHSLIVLDPTDREVVAFIVGYERLAEDNTEYPTDSLHLKSISVSSAYQNQGIGRKLIQIWLDFNTELGFKHLQGAFVFSVQTNSAEWNSHVQKLYESFGFVRTGNKEYIDKTDVIYYLK